MWMGDVSTELRCMYRIRGADLQGGKQGGDKSANLLASSRPLSMIGTSLADSKDLRWIDDFGDELTMAIATRNFDEAVAQVEKGQSSITSNVDCTRLKTRAYSN